MAIICAIQVCGIYMYFVYYAGIKDQDFLAILVISYRYINVDVPLHVIMVIFNHSVCSGILMYSSFKVLLSSNNSV